jgi:hypothetical protein
LIVKETPVEKHNDEKALQDIETIVVALDDALILFERGQARYLGRRPMAPIFFYLPDFSSPNWNNSGGWDIFLVFNRIDGFPRHANQFS